MSEPRKILVTSALPYANGSIHLGHMLEYIQTDMWVRFQKHRGNQCIYVCADDAHGSAIMLRAEKEGITPEQLIANVQAEHSADFAEFLVDFDNFHSTHSEENRAEEDTEYNNNPTNLPLDWAYVGIKAKTKGYEAEISGELAPGWQLQAGYTHKISRDDSGKKISTWEPEISAS